MIRECLHLIFMRINIEHLMLYKINCLMLDRSANIIMEISKWYTCNCHAYCNKTVQWELLFAMATINWICRRWCFALNKSDWVSNWMFQIHELYFTQFFTFFFPWVWISFFLISMCSSETNGIKLSGTLGHFVLWLF